MKCFVSGRSSNFSEIVRVTHLLREAGHEITHDWTTLPMIKPYQDNEDQAGEYAVLQMRGIAAADAYIILAHEDGTGLFAELGARAVSWETKYIRCSSRHSSSHVPLSSGHSLVYLS